MMRLGRRALVHLPPTVQVPRYDVANLGVGIVHLGLGAFHRAHQAVFTEDAILADGGDWGILGVSLRHSAVADALREQDDLYTVELLGTQNAYRVVGAVRRTLSAPTNGKRLLEALASPDTHVVTMTVTENGYCLGIDGELDFSRPEIARDLENPHEPSSAIGWLARGAAARCLSHGTPLTIISCDNLKSNGLRLQHAVTAFAERAHIGTVNWLRSSVAFPQTVVDCIVPAATVQSRRRAAQALGVDDDACVQREVFSQWVIENHFAGPRPAWERAGAELVEDVAGYGRLKLQVLNTCHSALAYLGLARGYSLVREAIADPELVDFLDGLVRTEIAPVLQPLGVADYWRTVLERFRNPSIDHRLAQIAEDGSLKLAERVFPLIVANARSGASVRLLARIVRAWLDLAAAGPTKDPRAPELAAWAAAGADLGKALKNPALFPPEIRCNARVRTAIIQARA